uniref:non-specific serine/threonine protein kinase n=1 Tax=Leersia perrieri TaxID=77586 RepID=A0A0D9XZG4_9ORYZ
MLVLFPCLYLFLLFLYQHHYLLLHAQASEIIASSDELIYNGFSEADLKLDGGARLLQNNLILDNGPHSTSSRALCNNPLSFRKLVGDSMVPSSFSTTFVFAIPDILPKHHKYKGYGLVFMLSTTSKPPGNLPGKYLGLAMDGGDSNSDQFFAVELDTMLDPEFSDIDGNHVGIDVNSLISLNSSTAGFYDTNGAFQTLPLHNSKLIQVWVDYKSKDHRLSITLAPYPSPKPKRPLLLNTVNLSSVLSSSMYAGFSAASRGSNILGWSLKVDGEAQPLDNDYHLLPAYYSSTMINIRLLSAPVVAQAILILILAILICCRLRKMGEQDELKINCGLPPYTYKQLFTATEGFDSRMLLGRGGFGKVYRGLLPRGPPMNVAIKRVSPESKQGMKEFMAEIAILGSLRHRNLVQLLGYCRHKDELLLVYDYMPNGSLDRHLYDKKNPTLSWAQRFCIIKGVANGLFYLHEDWERVIIHRDIKASNILLDNEMNGRLSDFGLARLHDHGADAHVTRVAGTIGYIAPELARLRKASKATDVFAFGVFMMEVVCGRKPNGVVNGQGEPVLLTDWVLSKWQGDSIMESVDQELEDCIQEEAELLLKLALLCSHSSPKVRPCMRLVMLYLERGATLPEFLPSFLNIDPSISEDNDQFEPCLSVATSVTSLSGGR